MRGAIFMCNRETRTECFRFKVFGLPASKESFVRQIKKGMILFLFDTDGRKMYGVYEAISDGGMNIEPDAYVKTGSSFPAQVRFKIIWKCKPLKEEEFKPAIIANYFSFNKFNFHLNFEQVGNLLSLFKMRKKITPDPFNEKTISHSSYTSSSNSHSPYTGSRFGSNPQPDKEILSNPYQFQTSNFDNRSLITNPNPSSNPDPLVPQQYYSTCADTYQYQYDPENPGITSSLDYNLQKYQKCQYQTGIGTGTVPDSKCNTGLNQDQTKPPSCDFCAIKNKGIYASSSQPLQFFTSNPEYFGNVSRGAETSNSVEGSRPHDHISNLVPENFYASVIEKLKEIPSTHQNPNFVSENPNPNPILFSETGTAKRASVFSRLACKTQRETASQMDEGPTPDQLLDSLSQKSKSNQWVNDRPMKPIKRPVQKQLSTENEAKVDPGLDGMEVDLTEPSLDNYEPDEPFLNFKRRCGERETNIVSEEGTKKKRRFVRPSLEIEGPKRKFDTPFDEPLKETETQERNVKKVSKEAEIEFESLGPAMHGFEGKTEEKIVIPDDFIEIESKKQNQDLEGPICKNGPSEETEIERESLGPTTDKPQEKEEIMIFSSLLQFNEEKNTDQLKSVGPTQADTLSCGDGKNDISEKYPTPVQEPESEKIELEEKNHLTDPESGIPNDKTEPESGIPKPGLASELRSLIKRAIPKKLNETGPRKDQDEILNEDFIALE